MSHSNISSCHIPMVHGLAAQHRHAGAPQVVVRVVAYSRGQGLLHRDEGSWAQLVPPGCSPWSHPQPSPSASAVRSLSKQQKRGPGSVSGVPPTTQIIQNMRSGEVSVLSSPCSLIHALLHPACAQTFQKVRIQKGEETVLENN